HGLLHVAHFQGEVENLPLCDADLQIRASQLLETGLLDRHRVGSDRKAAVNVETSLRAVGNKLLPGKQLLGDDMSAGNHCSVRIGTNAVPGAGALLRPYRSGG